MADRPTDDDRPSAEVEAVAAALREFFDYDDEVMLVAARRAVEAAAATVDRRPGITPHGRLTVRPLPGHPDRSHVVDADGLSWAYQNPGDTADTLREAARLYAWHTAGNDLLADHLDGKADRG